MNYVERDTYGMYKTNVITGPDMRHGPGPDLMGAETLVGSDVYNKNGDDLGDIKEIMLDMRTGRVAYAVLSSAASSAWAASCSRCHGPR